MFDCVEHQFVERFRRQKVIKTLILIYDKVPCVLDSEIDTNAGPLPEGNSTSDRGATSGETQVRVDEKYGVAGSMESDTANISRPNTITSPPRSTSADAGRISIAQSPRFLLNPREHLPNNEAHNECMESVR